MVKKANSSSSNKVFHFPSPKQEGGGLFFEIAMEKFCFNLVSEEVLMRPIFITQRNKA